MIKPLLRKLNTVSGHMLSDLYAAYGYYVTCRNKRGNPFIETLWDEVELPTMLLGIPSMLTFEEKRYLYWYAAHQYTGTGRVLVYGAWVGSSTAVLCQGISDNANTLPGDMFVYDRFTWAPSYMDGYFPQTYKEGDDFSDAFDFFTRRWASGIRCFTRHLPDKRHRPEDLPKEKLFTWNNGPVEIAYLDCGDEYEKNDYLLSALRQSFIPGKTVVMWQDYGRSFLPEAKSRNFEIARVVEKHKHNFQLIHRVRQGNLAAFRWIA